jgi:hypothetical protein
MASGSRTQGPGGVFVSVTAARRFRLQIFNGHLRPLGCMEMFPGACSTSNGHETAVAVGQSQRLYSGAGANTKTHNAPLEEKRFLRYPSSTIKGASS